MESASEASQGQWDAARMLGMISIFLLIHSELRRILLPYYELNFVTGQVGNPMFARFPLHAMSADDRSMRLADWWPAALIGLLALLSAAPDSNAQTLLGLL
jgi:hypothetical protein